MVLLDSTWAKENWIQFILYDDPQVKRDWKQALDWYHDVLGKTVRPVVKSAKNSIEIVLFTHYGPFPYEPPEARICQHALQRVPDKPTRFVRLRLFPAVGQRENIIKELDHTIRTQKSVWDYEILTEYDVLGDLGNRYGRGEDGSVDHERTLLFIRYWDAGCRYILSVVPDSGNWEKNVDVWGVPHLINNALGSWLRHPSVKCKCGELGYMGTALVDARLVAKDIRLPMFAFACPRCGSQWIGWTNI